AARRDFRRRFRHQQLPKKSLEPKRTLVFVTMNDLQHFISRHDNGPRTREMPVVALAVGTFKLGCDGPLERESAMSAKRRLNISHRSPACRADKSLLGGCSFVAANLADFGVNEGEGCLEDWPHRIKQGVHVLCRVIPAKVNPQGKPPS